jgi:glycosyltransferase involved in cell wall biosynthesis
MKPKIIRYNKFKRKNLSIKNIEENLMPYILYVKSIKEGNVPKIFHNKSYSKPKVTFIASVFNKEKYLESFISSIQMQVLKEIEIIIIDDFSIDKSGKIINNFIKRDKRIKMIKNKKNMGSLYSRAIGGNIAKAEYIIFFDSDDIILKEGILKAYHHSVKFNLDIVQFLSILQKNETIYTTNNYYKYKNVINQPVLNYIFYCNSTGLENNVALWDKLVKKKVVLKSLEYIGRKYIQNRLKIENDVILLYTIFKMAKSYQFIDSFGYYYFRTNQDSISNTWNNPEKSNEIIYSVLTNVKFLYEKSNNTFYDKYFCVFKVKQSFTRYKKILKYADKQFDFMKNLFNTLFDSQFISNKDKLTLIKLYFTIFNLDGSIRK